MYSVASCMGIHTYEELHKAGKHVDGVEVDTSGERREQSPKVYTKIGLKMRLRGAGLERQDVEAAIHHALTSSCSIAVMVNMVAPITCEYEVDGTSLKGAVTAPPAKL
jgi:putative redox protein